MANSVHFIVIKDEPIEKSAHLVLAAQIASHYAAQGLKVFILTEDQAMAAELDDVLFALPLEQFTPHAQSQFAPRYAPPVLIGAKPPNNFMPVLVNLSDNAPEFRVKCRHILDLVPTETHLKELARLRYRQYQQLGLQPQTCDKSELPSFN